MIIRGSNYYPQDIERVVERCHPALSSGGTAAFSIEIDHEEQLVILQEVKKRIAEFDSHEVLRTIRNVVGEECGLQPYVVVLVQTRSLFKTSSGKIQRQQCRQAFLSGSLKEIKKSVFDSNDKSTKHKNTYRYKQFAKYLN